MIIGEKRNENQTDHHIHFSLPALLFFMEGCSSRSEIAVIEPDSTIVYPPKDPDGVKVKISFCRNVYKKTGKRIGEGTVFTIRENENVRAFADLENCFFHNQRDLMFHLDWIDANGNSVYKKQIILSPLDSTSSVSSTFSIGPDKRQPGTYMLRVYLYRELIAEKYFTLLAESTGANQGENAVSASITLCKSKDKKTGERVGVDTVFTVREKEKVMAIADLRKPVGFKDEDLIFNFEWIDSTGKAFYQKEIELTRGDSSSSISSSISVSPETRKPGNYVLRLYLYNDLIAEQKFRLQPEPPIIKYITENLKATIMLCRKVDKKTGERIGADTVFTIRDKQNVKAIADLAKMNIVRDRDLLFTFDWKDANGKSVYQKDVKIKPGDSFAELNSSISIAPDKRQPGKYTVQLSVFNKVIAERRFELKAK